MARILPEAEGVGEVSRRMAYIVALYLVLVVAWAFALLAAGRLDLVELHCGGLLSFGATAAFVVWLLGAGE